MSHVDFLEIEPGIRLHVRDWGEGRPVLFLHGWPLGQELWEYQFTELSRHGYRCVGVSLRGFGRSSQPWGGYDYDTLAADVHRVIEILELREVALVGFSMGGAIALRYAAIHNDDGRVTRLALCGAAAPSFTLRPDFPHGLPAAAVNEFIDACRNDRPKLIEEFGKIFYRDERSVSRKFAEWIHNMAMHASPRATAECLVALRDADLRDDMTKVKMPTAILHSKHDKVCPFGLAESLAAGIAGARLIEFDNSGHALFYEEKDKFNAELAKFLGKAS